MVEIARSLLLPPGINLVLLVAGFLSLALLPRFGRWCLALGILTLYLFSFAPVATFLVGTVETARALPQPVVVEGEQAIVVLGAGRYYDAPEYGGDTSGRSALERLRYAQHLQEQTRLPILATGGRPRGETLSEAELMEQTLKESFSGIAKWTEERSRNTFENAVCSRFILSGENIDHIFLVTHAAHMPRAAFIFEQAGFAVTPAPTAYLRSTFKAATPVEKWLPGSTALQITRTALHEWLGILYYRINYGSADAVRTAPARC